jgi:hypothetical protein
VQLFFDPKIHYCTLLRLLSVQEGSEGCSEKSLKHKGRRHRYQYSRSGILDPGYGAFLTLRSGIPDPTNISESVELKIQKKFQMTQIFFSTSSKKLKIKNIFNFVKIYDWTTDLFFPLTFLLLLDPGSEIRESGMENNSF